MSNKKNIPKYLRELIGAEPANSLICRVKSVQDYTCTVVAILDDVEIPEVRINAGTDPNEGIVIKPAVDSVVRISAQSETDWMVSLYSKIDSISIKIGNISLYADADNIVFNENTKSSFLTDINKLVNKVNALENDLNTLKSIFTAWAPAPMDGGAVLKTASATWASQSITPTTVNDLKDDKIKH